ncbi:alkaline phosphatase PhoD [Actinocorallia lasiicapitis]
MTRRTVLSAGGLSALAAIPLAPLPEVSAAVPDPFRLGVASGEPTADGVVLWTRLATRPLAEDGLGGMGKRAVRVDWQIAEDERFRKIVRAGTATASPRSGFAVHVEVGGLRPDGEYFYRFRASGHLSPAGRTRTAPAPGSMSPLLFAAASCAHYEHGYFTAYRRLAERHPDLVVHLGDYMYEYSSGAYVGANGVVRKHTGGKLQSLADYRRRHAQYKSDPDLRAAHAAAPWAVIWDDHELEDNWAGKTPGTGAPGFSARKRNAMRAYYENMPLRRGSLPHGTKIQLYRRLRWGSLATLHLLDTRQYRSDQACDDWSRTDCEARLSGARTLMGARQLDWLADGLRASGARWDLLGQQVFLAQRDFTLGPARELSMDAWDGYAADRDRLFAAIRSSGVRNPVVLTGDVHTAYAADLLRDFDDPSSARIGVELVATSIASDGDGYDDRAANAALLAENPHLAFTDQRRGFLLSHVTGDSLTAEFHHLPRISRQGAPSRLAARFTIPDGTRSLAR